MRKAVESPRKITNAMKKVDLVLIVGFAAIIGLFTFVGYNRIIEAANTISRGISPAVFVAEPPVVQSKLETVDNYGIQETVNPQVVGENASNNWGQ